MKTISILLALVNALFAGFLLAYSLSSIELHGTGTVWLLTKSLAALSIIAISILTWHASARVMNASPLLIGDLYLVVLGTVTILCTYHLFVLSSDMEYYMAVFGSSLMTQGMTSFLETSTGEIIISIS